jgi:hypothetical protein
MKFMTATLAHAKGEISLTFGYIVLWTGEDLEVTIVDPEPPNTESMEFIDRFHTVAVSSIPARVEAILRRELLKQCRDIITVEYE